MVLRAVKVVVQKDVAAVVRAVPMMVIVTQVIADPEVLVKVAAPKASVVVDQADGLPDRQTPSGSSTASTRTKMARSAWKNSRP